jgi:co-chaperonin GroES (HSP10)
MSTNKSENENIEVGDKVIMNRDYSAHSIYKGEIGKVKRLPYLSSAPYKVKFKGKKAVEMYRYRFDLLPTARKSATVAVTTAVSPEPVKEIPAKDNEIKVGDKVIMNQDYRELAKKGYKGEVVSIRDFLSLPFLYQIKLKKKFRLSPLWIPSKRFNVVPAKGSPAAKPVNEAPVNEAPVKKGIRITVREVKRDVFEIVDFTALDWRSLPPEYRDGFPYVGIQDGYLRVSESKDCHRGFCRGNFLTRVQLDELVETFKKAGERLQRINTYPKKRYEIVI